MLKESIDKDKRIAELEAQVKELKNLVHELISINKSLQNRLSKYENPKNSRNSSIPPSKDENRPFKVRAFVKKVAKSQGDKMDMKAKPLKWSQFLTK